MSAYILYNNITGEIIQTGFSYEDSHLSMVNESVHALYGEADLLTQYINVDTLTVVDKPIKPSKWHSWDWPTHQWVLNLDVARSDKSTLISNDCKADILSGFTSAALGSDHHYPAKFTDQQNLASSVLASMLPGVNETWVTPFWCEDVNGLWAFRPHTVSQIQQVGSDAKMSILASMTKNEDLQYQISIATTIEELNLIVW